MSVEQERIEVHETVGPAGSVAFLPLRCEVTAAREMTLPEWKSSLIRGLLGHSLLRMVCVFPGSACRSCPLQQSCAFPLFFSESLGGAGGRERGAPRAAPLVIDASDDRRRHFSAGDSFSVHVRLFGVGVQWAPHIIGALADALPQKGLVLSRVHTKTHVAFDYEHGWRESVFEPDSVALPCLQSAHQPEGEPSMVVRIGFLTPFRVKEQNSLARSLPFSVVFRAAWRRLGVVAASNAATSGVAPLVAESSWFAAAGRVVTLQEAVAWRDLTRKSTRQGCVMQLGGLTGHVIYEGVPQRLLTVLQCAAMFHLGKQTSFGLGRVEVSFQGK